MIPKSDMMPASTSAVTAERLVLSYAGRPVLEDVTFAVQGGAGVAIIGPNGSGKSTLLRALAGLLAPVAGHLQLPASGVPGGVALVLQSTVIDPSLPLTVREAVTMARYARRGLFGRLRSEDRDAVDTAMARMNVSELASRQLQELSGGQRQRVLVAQGLAQGAEVLLLDEPFTGVDVLSRELIVEALEEERHAGRTVFVSTHELADARRADLVVLLAGRLVTFGPPAAVLTDAVLADAYGSRVVHLADGAVYVDDPHHHDDPHRRDGQSRR